MNKNLEILRDLFNEQIHTREIRVAPSTYKADDHSFEAICTSEAPTKVIDYDRWEIVDEVLLMSGFSLPEGRSQVPLLDTHDRSTIDNVMGSAMNFAPAGEVLKGRGYFSTVPRAQDAETKVKEGHVTDLSIGYRVDESYYVPEGEKQIIAGRTFKGPVKVSTKWTLKELSLCPIGADVFAMVREIRAMPDLQEFFKSIIKPANHVGAGIQTKTTTEGVKTMEDPNKSGAPAVQPVVGPSVDQMLASMRAEMDAMKLDESEAKRKQEINHWKSRFVGRIEKIDELADNAIKNGTSAELFKGMCAERMAESNEPFTNDHKLGLSSGQAGQFSISRFIHAAAVGKRELAPFEFDCSDAIEKQLDLGSAPRPADAYKSRSIWIPYDVMHRSLATTPRQLARDAAIHGLLGKRTLSAGSTADGGYLVGTNLLASEFIEFPRNITLMQQLGALVLPGLVGNIDIPKKIGASTFYHVSTEGNAPTGSALTTGKVSLTPKIGGTYSDYTLKLLLQSTPSIDALVQADLLETVDVGVDHHCFHGSNASGEPKGLFNQSSIGDVSGVDFGWASVVEFMTDLKAANTMRQKLAWALSTSVWGICVQTKMDLYVSEFLLDLKTNTMAGKPVFDSNQIDDGYAAFGDWSQALIGFWGGYNLLVDPFTASSAGTTRVRVLTAYDFAVRMANAFSCSDDIA